MATGRHDGRNLLVGDAAFGVIAAMGQRRETLVRRRLNIDIEHI